MVSYSRYNLRGIDGRCASADLQELQVCVSIHLCSLDVPKYSV
jgi:hypothetical protein